MNVNSDRNTMIRLADSIPSSLAIYIYPLTYILQDARMLSKASP